VAGPLPFAFQYLQAMPGRDVVIPYQGAHEAETFFEGCNHEIDKVRKY